MVENDRSSETRKGLLSILAWRFEFAWDPARPDKDHSKRKTQNPKRKTLSLPLIRHSP